MNKKLVFTILGFAILVVIVLSVALARRAVQTTNQPTAPKTLTIKTSQGDIVMNNFTAAPQEQHGTTDVIEQNKDFSIVGFADQGGFIITLLSNPLSASRSAAEQAFLKDLNISAADACKLNVTLAVPMSVNQKFAGKNYGLSFCLNGKKF